MNFKYSKISALLLGLLGSSSVLCTNQGEILLRHSGDGDNSVEFTVTINEREYTQRIDLFHPNLIEANDLVTPIGRIEFDNVYGENIAVINSNVASSYGTQDYIKISFDSNCNLKLRLPDILRPYLGIDKLTIWSDGNVYMENNRLNNRLIDCSINCRELTIMGTLFGSKLEASVDVFTSQCALFFDTIEIRPRRAQEAIVTTQNLFVEDLLELVSCAFTAEGKIRVGQLQSTDSDLRILEISSELLFWKRGSEIDCLTGRINTLYLGDNVELLLPLVALATPPRELQGTGKLIFGTADYNLAYPINDERAMATFLRLVNNQDLNEPRECIWFLGQEAEYQVEVNQLENQRVKNVQIRNNLSEELVEFALNFHNGETVKISNSWFRLFFTGSTAKILMPQLAIQIEESSTQLASYHIDGDVSATKLFYRDPTGMVSINNDMTFIMLDIECDEFRNNEKARLRADTIEVKANLMRNAGKIKVSDSFSISARDENIGGVLYNHGKILASTINIDHVEVTAYVKTWKTMHADVLNFNMGSLILKKVENWQDEMNSLDLDFMKIIGTPRLLSLLGENNELIISYWLGRVPEAISGEGSITFEENDINGTNVRLNTEDAGQNLAIAIQTSQAMYREKEEDAE